MRSPLPPAAAPLLTGYERRVEASLARVWENVLDWEHLPWLHRSSFASIELHDAGDWGWRARAALRTGGEPFDLELMVDRARSRYVTRTLSGRWRARRSGRA